MLWPQAGLRAEEYCKCKQENPAVADKPARRESIPKIAPIRRAYMYNVVADNTDLQGGPN